MGILAPRPELCNKASTLIVDAREFNHQQLAHLSSVLMCCLQTWSYIRTSDKDKCLIHEKYELCMYRFIKYVRSNSMFVSSATI